LIENWHVSDFHISAARTSPDAGVAEHLSSEGENLPLVAQFLYENHRKIFDEILAIMRRRVPGISDVEARQTEDGRIVLRFQDGSFKDPFIARFVSDGTIKMFAYLVLLHDPKPHPLLCVEEPENQLYPNLMEELAEEFQSYASRGGQVFVSTHSPDFLNAVPVQSLFVISKEHGLSVIRPAAQFDQISNLVDAGDKLGWLWRQGMFKGISPQ
jgi:predicted ATPase